MKPKLTLRDLFWLVLVAAMALGWWSQNRKLAADVEKLRWKVIGLELERDVPHAFHASRKPDR